MQILEELRSLGLVRDLRFTNRQTGEVESKSLVLFDGLMLAARKSGLKGITTTLVVPPTKENNWTTVVHAAVTTEAGTYTGIGDANPANVTGKIAPHAPRMAETRAVARALRLALGLRGVICQEEFGELPHSRSSGVNGNNSRDAIGHESPRRHSNGRGRPPRAIKPISEPQRRFLFRLLAEEGLKGQEAHDELLRIFGVGDLSEVSSVRASKELDRRTGKVPMGTSRASA